MILEYYLSWTKTAKSQAAKASLVDKNFFTSSSGISRKTRVFLPACKEEEYIHTSKQLLVLPGR